MVRPFHYISMLITKKRFSWSVFKLRLIKWHSLKWTQHGGDLLRHRKWQFLLHYFARAEWLAQLVRVALQPQGFKFNPWLCRSLTICATLFSANARSAFHPKVGEWSSGIFLEQACDGLVSQPGGNQKLSTA